MLQECYTKRLIQVNPLATNATIVALVIKNEITVLRDNVLLTHNTLAIVTL